MKFGNIGNIQIGKTKTMSTLKTVHEGYWGNWTAESNIPDGYYIRGMRIRFEPSQGSHGDDTALNGIELICRQWGGNADFRLMIHEGFWGDWRDDVVLPDNCYLIGLSVRMEPPQGDGDDTALNGITLFGRDSSTNQVVTKVAEQGIWGAWMNPVMADQGSHVTGMQIRIEEPIGHGDDTAMNGIRIRFNNIPTNPIVTPNPGNRP